MKIKEITDVIERFAPLRWQESYDNAGLIVGRPDDEVHKALLAVDVTEEVLDEARREGCDLVISHHPIVFHPLKRFNSANPVERCVERAIRCGIALYACHTNLDSAPGGMSWRLAGMLGVENLRVLQPADGIGDLADNSSVAATAGAPRTEPAPTAPAPANATDPATQAPANATASAAPTPAPAAAPTASALAPAVAPAAGTTAVAGPDDAPGSVAFRPARTVGFGVVGELPEPVPTLGFMRHMKRILGVRVVRYSDVATEEVRRVAVCTGAGASLIGDARRAGADLYITADLKYNDFMTPDRALTVADIGHFESEYCAIQLLFDILSKNLITFAVRKSEDSRNPVNYLV